MPSDSNISRQPRRLSKKPQRKSQPQIESDSEISAPKLEPAKPRMQMTEECNQTQRERNLRIFELSD